MRQIFFLFIIIFLTFGHPARAKDIISNLIATQCGAACNGDTNLDCGDCKRRVINTFDQQRPVYPEMSFEINNGKLDFSF
ncbi:MAG: hypothetical protein K2W92_05320 [Alphaproteobacteria bacterium]|nr:hypothetical protein [Alphaproteobacteria bacterium]